jgi:hypothetical protein
MKTKLIKQCYQLLMPRHQALYTKHIGPRPKPSRSVGLEVYEILPTLELALNAMEVATAREKEMARRLEWLADRIRPGMTIEDVMGMAQRRWG